MLNKLTKILLLVVACLTCAPLLHAQSSNRVWFAIWNGQPTASSDVAVQSLATSGGALAVTNAISFVSQTNFPPFNAPYDIAVDGAMGKAYVLDNGAGSQVENIYAFNLGGSSAQIAASGQVIYSLSVPPADVTSNIYPVISGLALDPTNHYLYFNQFDPVTGTNSYVGRLSLATSSKSDAASSANGNPMLQTLYGGQIPGVGPIAIDATNLYLGAYDVLNGTNGIYAAPLSGAGSFSELVTVSAGNTTFTNGLISGVASYATSNLIYYLTFDGGAVNQNYSVGQNAIWTYNTATHVTTLIASNYMGYPNSIALDPANKRYYFTVGQDGTGNVSPTNYQAIYTGTLGSSNQPSMFYTPTLSGQDIAGGANAGAVSLQGLFVQDIPGSYLPPVPGTDIVTAQKNLTLELPALALATKGSDPNGGTLSLAAVNASSTNGGSVVLNGNYVFYTPTTNFVGKDQFTYTLVDSEGGQAQGVVNINVLSLNPPIAGGLAMTGAPNQLFLLYHSSLGGGYTFMYANSLYGPWIALSPGLAAQAGDLIEYDDLTTSGVATRFYRVVGSGQ
jgi:hypothetical protein